MSVSASAYSLISHSVCGGDTDDDKNVEFFC